MTTAAAVVNTSTSSTPIPPAGGAGRPSRRKQRCWIFQVNGVTSDVTEADLLASVRERYTTVKRLVVRPAVTPPAEAVTAAGAGHVAKPPRNNLVEVQFTGPQPSEGPGALLCDLLCGSSVEAQPVELPRGRKKRTRTDASSEASDSDFEDGNSRKMGGNRNASTNSLQHVGEEDEEESPGGGRCITSKPLFGAGGQGGSPMYRGKNDEPSTLRRNSVHDSGGAVAVSSGLTPVSPVGLFRSPPLPSDSAPVSSSSCAVVPAEQRSAPAVMPPQHRVVSQDGVQQQPQHLLATQQQQQQLRTSSGGQWDDVVGRVTTPQDSSHSFDTGSIDLSSSGSQPPVKSEFGPLLVSSSSAGAWGSNDSQSALLGPMPPPQAVQPPLRGWSFDSAQMADGAAGEFGSGNMVMDLSDVDTLFRSTEGEVGTAVGLGSSFSAGSMGSNADAGAGGRQEQQQEASKWTAEGVLPMEKVVIEPSRRECDFEGRPPPASSSTTGARAPTPAAIGGQCHLVFTGLQNTGHDLRSLRVTAHFGVDSVHKVGKVTSPVQAGANGRAYAAVFYPSMQEIWPELYSTSNIRVVQVDVVVEIRSDCGEYQYVGPQLKVTYLRASPPADAAESAPRPSGRRTASRAPIPFANEGPQQVSYSCVDYSCTDWFSDMCHSVFRGGATSHQPLPEDPIDLMTVDS